MNLLKNILLNESRNAAQREMSDAVELISSVFSDWNKMGRRKNAVDLITSSANRLSRLDPAIIPLLHDSARTKLALICIKCMDIPFWKPVEQREKIYKKIYNILTNVENMSPNTTSTGNVRDIIMTRLSAAIAYNRKSKTLVCYEPKVSPEYVKYLLGDYSIDRVYRASSLPLPENFSTLINTLNINQDKADKLYLNK